MRILLTLNYYAPYVSGLTNVARDVAEGLAARGNDVLVLTTQHDRALARSETINGVRVRRFPVRFRLGKGVIAPALVPAVIRAARTADVVNIHAPMLEAGPIAAGARRAGTPVLFTYQCDIAMPPSLLGRLQSRAMDASTTAAAGNSRAVIVSSSDYAAHSRVSRALARNQLVIPPGCHDRRGGTGRFRESDGLHVGFLGRIVEEKGIEYLVRGFTALGDPEARLLIAGDFAHIAGGSVIARVREAIGRDDRIRMLGFLADDDLRDFYASLDAFALTSVNSFEAFGIVQVEAMMAGVPALVTDMPGVRTPVQETGFGTIVPPRDSAAITSALRKLPTLPLPGDGPDRARALFTNERGVQRYQDLIDEVLEEAGRGTR
ncbi:glycosyltransferase family 4 protein [Microbacterium lushaniae]|nr:glycosyltransferase family 4 protein [Microbacterium lushaniae]KAA9152713.1 glycosyltransferase family 4 protein [Microbacterium lushaniae]